MQEDKDNLIENVRAIYCFKVKNNDGKEGMWIINAKTGKGSVTYYGKGLKMIYIIYFNYFYLIGHKSVSSY